MKKLMMTLALLGGFAGAVQAQCSNVNSDLQLYSGSIAEPGIAPANTWINDNLNNWKVAHGSPDVVHTAGNNHIQMISLFSTGSGSTGEGVYTDYLFAPGQTYEITYDLLRYGTINADKSFKVKLASGLTPNYSTAAADFAFPSPATEITVSDIDWSSTGSWVTITETFTVPVTGTYNQVWFHPFTTGELGLAAIDNVCINRKPLGTPCEMSPNFHISIGKCQYYFTNATTFPGGSAPIVLETSWTFGDGTSATGSTVQHAYELPGSYTICMTIWTTDGVNCCKRTICRSIKVTGICSPCERMESPGVGITANNTGGLTPDFALTGFPGDMGGLLGYYWNFGDGNTGTGSNPTHTYASAGTYSVCVTMFYQKPKSSICCSRTVCLEVTVGTGGMAPITMPIEEMPGENDRIEELKAKELNVFPNPTSGTITVQHPDGQPLGLVKVFDQAGNVVYEVDEKVDASTFLVDLSMLSSGIYFLLAEAESNTPLFTKVVVE